MGKITVVTGGARSGKSSFAEKKIGEIAGDILYIATSIPFDEEMVERVKKHKAQRPSNWITLEAYENLAEGVKGQGKIYKGILLDCITLMVTNQMLQIVGMDGETINKDTSKETEYKVKKELECLVKQIRESATDLVLVTNEVGYGIVPENKFAREFRDIAGRVNAFVAAMADEVYLVVCGIPMRVK